jgi:hypothetical protein
MRVSQATSVLRDRSRRKKLKYPHEPQVGASMAWSTMHSVMGPVCPTRATILFGSSSGNSSAFPESGIVVHVEAEFLDYFYDPDWRMYT